MTFERLERLEAFSIFIIIVLKKGFLCVLTPLRALRETKNFVTSGAGFQTVVYKSFKKSERKLTFDFFLHSHSVSLSNQKNFVPLCLRAFVFQILRDIKFKLPSPFGGRVGEGGFQFKIHRRWLGVKIIRTRFYKSMLGI